MTNLGSVNEWEYGGGLIIDSVLLAMGATIKWPFGGK